MTKSLGMSLRQQILLDFGISLAPGIAISKSNGVFLRGILRVKSYGVFLRGMLRVIVYRDDVLITGSLADEHL